MMRPRPRVLLVCARLFDYQDVIIEGLEHAGFEVTWWDPRPSSSTIFRTVLRLWPRLVSRLVTSRFKARLTALDVTGFEHILVIKGEGLSADSVLAMRHTLPQARMTLYLWDGLENAAGAKDIARHFDRVFTFDPTDARTHGWTYRPLFSREATMSQCVARDIEYECSFVGTIHSDRHRVLRRLRIAHPAWRIFAYCYFQSRSVLIGRQLLDPTLWLAPPGTLHTVPMPPTRVEKTFACSKSVLDIEHPRQRGLTMRTIESLLAGRKLITTNANIVASDLYHPSRVCVIDRRRPHVPQQFLDQPFETVEPGVRNLYSVDAWLNVVLELTADEAGPSTQANPTTTGSPVPGRD